MDSDLKYYKSGLTGLIEFGTPIFENGDIELTELEIADFEKKQLTETNKKYPRE